VTQIGVFLAAIDGTIVATLSGPISASFNASYEFSWIASAYLIANAACQPLSGRLTDIFGRRSGMVFSNIFFGVGTLICGLASSSKMLIAGRVIAGIGGGGLFSISTFIGSDLIPLRKRGVWQGLGNVCYGLGSGTGGLFGGWINDTYGWRWAFLIQVPFIIVSGILVAFVVKVPVRQSDKSALKRVDFAGAFTLMASLVLLLFGLNAGGNTVPWSHPLVLTTLPLSAVFLALFIYIENKVAEPVIPVKLLLDRTVAAACLTNWFDTMAVFAVLFYGPIYFQVGKGLSATEAGVRIIPWSIGGGSGSLICGLIMKATGKYFWLNVVVQAFFVAACAVTCTFDLGTPDWVPYIPFFVYGFGYGGMLTITLLALIAAVGHEHQAVITSASYAFRSTGSTIGITVASAVFQNVLKAQLWARIGERVGGPEIIRKIRDSADEVRHLPKEWRGDVQDAYMGALRSVFFLSFALAVTAGVISLFMREHKLHSNLSRK
jgi:EmrB/QacA subfamily drug resistance transporter